MEYHYVKIEFTCTSGSDFSDTRQWLEEELEATAIDSNYYADKRTGAVGFGPYSQQDIVPFMRDVTALLYSGDAPVDVTSCRIYQRKK